MEIQHSLLLDKALARLQSNLGDRTCKAYLSKRHLDEEFCSLTHVGFISEHLAEQQFRSSSLRELFLSNQERLRYKSHLLFPCYNYEGDFCGFIGRATFETPFKYLLPENILFNKSTFMLGWEDLQDTDTVFLSENIIEYGRIKQCGFNAVSLNGAYKSRFKISMLANRFKHLVVVADNDQAGFALKDYIKEYLSEYNVSLSFVQHNEKGLDEFFIRNGKEQTIKLLQKYA